MDVLKVYDATRHALDRIRRGGGPQFIECETYRYRGHSMADPGTYRPAVEVKAYQAHRSALGRDPRTRIPLSERRRNWPRSAPDNIGRLAEHMVDAGHRRAKRKSRAIKKEVQKAVDDAVAVRSRRARSRPWTLRGRRSATATGTTKS